MILKLRTDQVAGAAAIVLGVAVLAISGDLPFGSLSYPGAGMFPKLLCGCLIIFGIAVMFSGGDAPPVADAGWGDLRHAVPVFAIAAAAIALHTTLGFILSIGLMLFGLVLLERRSILRAAIYGAGVSVATYALFEHALRAPLARGMFGF
ncbi:MAG: tripartite tricarboxylate transporter TctB family protein [Xanthobacteraceae bacterium]